MGVGGRCDTDVSVKTRSFSHLFSALWPVVSLWPLQREDSLAEAEGCTNLCTQAYIFRRYFDMSI